MPAGKRPIPQVEETLTLIKLERPAEKQTRAGRKKKLEFPPLPQEMLDGMTELEQQHFYYFLDAMTADNKLQASDYIGLYMAAFEYVQLLRMHARQLQSGELISQARQHPGVQLRQWLETMSFSRNKRPVKKEGDEDVREMMKALAG